MSLISRMRRQTAVYWPLGSGGDDYDNHGQPILGDGIEISVRWEAKTVEFIGPEGTRELSNAVVYVDRDVEIGGVLMLGTLADVDSSGDLKQNDEAWEIRRYEKLPNLRNTEFLRTVFM